MLELILIFACARAFYSRGGGLWALFSVLSYIGAEVLVIAANAPLQGYEIGVMLLAILSGLGSQVLLAVLYWAIHSAPASKPRVVYQASPGAGLAATGVTPPGLHQRYLPPPSPPAGAPGRPAPPRSGRTPTRGLRSARDAMNRARARDAD